MSCVDCMLYIYLGDERWVPSIPFFPGKVGGIEVQRQLVPHLMDGHSHRDKVKLNAGGGERDS